MYNDKVMDHFFNPRNVGEIENPDGVGQVGNPICGDMMRITLKVKDNRIEDIKFRTFGCGAAIATSSMVTELVKGLTLEEALEVSNKHVAEALGGLPPQKLHCSNLAADAVRAAIKDMRKVSTRRHRSGHDEHATNTNTPLNTKCRKYEWFQFRRITRCRFSLIPLFTMSLCCVVETEHIS